MPGATTRGTDRRNSVGALAFYEEYTIQVAECTHVARWERGED